MTANVIINPASPQKNKTLEKELIQQNIDAALWPCIPDYQNAVRSINLSHKQIIRFAKEQNIKEICIMEEDVMFPAPDGWQYFLANRPSEFDLYLGGAYGLNQMALERVATGNGPVEINNFAGLHCYIIRSGYYDKFLSLPENQHIDNQPGMGKFFVCAPFAALQHPGWSANARQYVDYNCDKRIIPPECVYYGTREKKADCGA